MPKFNAAMGKLKEGWKCGILDATVCNRILHLNLCLFSVATIDCVVAIKFTPFRHTTSLGGSNWAKSQ